MRVHSFHILACKAASVLFGRGGSLPTQSIYDGCKTLEALITQNPATKARAVTAGVFESVVAGMRAHIDGDPDIIDMASIIIMHLTDVPDSGDVSAPGLPAHRERALAAGVVEVLDACSAKKPYFAEKLMIIKNWLQKTA
jgi:hypothetical protein